MKLSNETIQVLKNFATINQSIAVDQGNKLRTISPSNTIIAAAEVEEEFPEEFAIFDLSQMLARLSLFDDPTIEFESQQLVIQSGTERSTLSFADRNRIVVPPSGNPRVPDPEMKFTLTADKFQKVIKAMNVASLPEIVFQGDGKKIKIVALDMKGTTRDVYSLELDKTKLKFVMVFRADNMKLLNDDYEVEISSKGIAHFKGSKAEYWVPAEKTSTFEG